MDENTNLNNAELNVANENEHFMITQDKIDEILPNGVAAAIVVGNVNNNHIENNEPITKKCVVPVDIPSPLKSSSFWPTPKLNISKPKPKLPSVATLDSCRQYHQKKEAEKQRQLQEKEERKRKGEGKANEKPNKSKKRVRRKKLDNEEKHTQSGEEKGKTQSNEENSVNDSYPSDEEENSNSENENEDSVNINHTGIVEISQNDIKENSFVVVRYDNQYYPGIIVELDGDVVRVKTMVRSGPTGWKWPTPDDVIWYLRSDLMEIIEQPNFAAVNKRGVFHVPGMQKY
ncbi:hypothetical protein JTB14_000699 [Gonioctena quinquepunctata]|nr:hypothetical protein JTB14_000699 [Gonioctena quinquepunctata]